MGLMHRNPYLGQAPVGYVWLGLLSVLLFPGWHRQSPAACRVGLPSLPHAGQTSNHEPWAQAEKDQDSNCCAVLSSSALPAWCPGHSPWDQLTCHSGFCYPACPRNFCPHVSDFPWFCPTRRKEWIMFWFKLEPLPHLLLPG